MNRTVHQMFFPKHEITEREAQDLCEINAQAEALAQRICRSIPEGQSRSIAVTRLNEAVTFCERGLRMDTKEDQDSEQVTMVFNGVELGRGKVSFDLNEEEKAPCNKHAPGHARR